MTPNLSLKTFEEFDIHSKEMALLAEITKGNTEITGDDIQDIEIQNYYDTYIISAKPVETIASIPTKVFVVISYDDGWILSSCVFFTGGEVNPKDVIFKASTNVLGRAMTLENETKANRSRYLFPVIYEAIKEGKLKEAMGNDYEKLLISAYTGLTHRKIYESSFTPNA